MIGLVLSHTRREFLEPQLDLLPVAVECPHGDVGEPRNHAADVRNAEAPFPSFVLGLGNRRDLGIDECDRVAVAVGLVGQQRDKQPQTLVNLRCREPNPVILVHRLHHVVDQLLGQRVAEVGGRDRTRRFAQHGMAHARDF